TLVYKGENCNPSIRFNLLPIYRLDKGDRGTPFTKRSLKREMAGRAPGHLMHGFRSGEGRQPILMSLPSLTD
ncbi:hypothetical protein, partial [Rhizobium leguminosarum]|uniref:hypothetical protein n=1 Tax=Rhizobium leguminosarum TaxID=384 RepID=UPI003F979FE7